ncbi:MAG: hypothetical protein F6K16_02940 [Symploca sp. SIO2B6]|nr:hypothetical protein [Symploca sp. SIO2B6]
MLNLPDFVVQLSENCCKKDELSGQMFDDELELAYAVINGVIARGERGEHSTERIKFNSYSGG